MTSRLHGSVLLADDGRASSRRWGVRCGGRAPGDRHASAAEAARLLADRSFDVFVVDHRMPGRTGLDLIRTSRRPCRKPSGHRSS